MTPNDLGGVKKAYFDLLDLIIKYRIKEPIGRVGLTHIPKTEVDSIQGLKFESYVGYLIRDSVLDTIKKGKKSLTFEISKINDVNTIIVDCLKTVEEMTAYKNSLIVEKGWQSVQVTSHGNGASLHFDMRRRNGSGDKVDLSNKEGKFVSYLLSGENIEKNRNEIAKGLGISAPKVSSFKNSIKRKLGDLGYTEEETDDMLRTYKR